MKKNVWTYSLYLPINKLFIPFFCVWTLVFTACEKEVGEGGTSHIVGKVMVEDYDKDGNLEASYFAQETRVYIIYGDNDIYDDDTRTHFDGNYQFRFLNKGTYTLYAYSKCDDCPSGDEPILQTVDITSRGETVVAPLLTVRK